MSGHSHWAGIKHQKGATDQKRAKVFSKLLMAISAAAKPETNPDFNPRLRTAVEKAREANVPQDAISRAVNRAKEAGDATEECLFEAYDQGGIPILIFAITDNKNRSVQEVKKILSNHSAKWAEPGSVRWAFEETAGERNFWKAKFPQEIPANQKDRLESLILDLESSETVQNVFVGTK